MAILFGDYCFASDVEREAISVLLFSKDVWCNLNDGRFIRQSSVAKTPNIRSSSSLYDQIKNVEVAGFIVAKRMYPGAPLKYLVKPDPIRKKKRYRPRKLEHAVYKKD